MGDMRRQRLDDRSLDEAIRRLVEAGSDAGRTHTGGAGDRLLLRRLPGGCTRLARRSRRRSSPSWWWRSWSRPAAPIGRCCRAHRLEGDHPGRDHDDRAGVDHEHVFVDDGGCVAPIGGDAASRVDEYNLATLAGRGVGLRRHGAIHRAAR